MKKIILSSILFASLSIVISSCKKGEEDPFLSLRSRKARICGDWDVTSIERSTSYVDSNSPTYSTTSTSSYNGSAQTTTSSTTSSGVTLTNTSTSSFITKYIIEKDNTYTLTITSTDGTYTEKGTWNFLGKNEAEDLKNREAVTFIPKTITSVDVSNGNATTTSTADGLEGRDFEIIKLKNKEMTFKFSNKTSSGGVTETEDYTAELKQ